MKEIKRINVRKFSRNMYSCLDELPLAVYNKKTGEIKFIVISKEEGGKYANL